MASKSKRARTVKQRNVAKDFMYWAIAVFIVKLIIISNVQGGAWLGADGENYLAGYDAMVKNGVFATEGKLSYWPAGYPLFILLLSIFGKSFVLTTLAIVQSAIYSFAVYFFTAQLAKTRLKNFSYFAFLLIILNPTLSLSSIAVGYESLTASCYLIVMGLIIKDFLSKNESKIIFYVIISSIIFGFMAFMQPRLIISGLITSAVWISIRKPWKFTIFFILISFSITLFFPATLVFRNHQAIGLNTISTNGSAAFNMGAGELATGGYDTNSKGVICNNLSTDKTKAENEKIICVLEWYLKNPIISAKLFLNKSKYLWSPWYGPEANGTMARNPWLKINPVKNIASTPDGMKIVSGGFGKFISWAWLLSGLLFMFAGAWSLFKFGKLEKLISLFCMISIGTNWIAVLLTIGDHRFRVPIMGLSLFLQSVGIQKLLFRRKMLIS